MNIHKTRASAVIAIYFGTASAFAGGALASSDIDTGNTRLASNLGGSVNPNFTGGTLELDTTTTVTQDFTVGNYSSNTIDAYGHGVVLSGALTGSGPLTFVDSVGNGYVDLTSNGNSYAGGTTISSGVLEIGNGGTSGWLTGNVANAATIEFNRGDAVVFDGTISGSGALTQLGGGTLTLTAANSYTGFTTITAGTLALTGSGSISNSSAVTDNGNFDISATSGVSIKSLSGTGTVQLGGQTLTITAGSGGFSGVISGTGGVTVNGGVQLLSGADTYSGPTIVNTGTLELGASAIGYNVADNGTVGFQSASAITMNGVVSGAGDVSQMGAGVTTIATAQAYTGLTTISAGTLALSGSGNIISSRSVIDNGIFSIAEATGGASIQSLSGGGAVQLGGQTLTLTNASGSFSGYISGAGGLTLAGGKESLSGASTYTGPTTIAAGTLLLSGPNSLAASTVVDNAALDISMVSNTVGANSTSIASLSGSGMVALGTNTLNLTNAADTFSGTMSGTGGLKISGGTEILSGANTYTGTTTIAAGTLALSATGSLAATSKISVSGLFDISAATSSGPIALASLSGSGTVNLGAQSLNLTNASDVFSGTIMGTGGLTVSGGTQILAGMNSYTGGTAISAGTLQIGNGSGGSIVGGVTDNGTLAFGGANSSAFAGVISGSGAVIQNGIGTTSLTAVNNYTGGTTIEAGTLQIGNGGVSGSIVGDVVDNGTLAFGRSDTTTFNGTISGTGGISLVSGTTILTAVESYSGATIINSNAGLALAGGGSIAASGSVTVNGIFDVSAATTAPQIASLAGAGSIALGNQSLTLTNASDIFSGTIAGSGNLMVNKGTETLTGANSYMGATTVNGVLLVNGSIASSSHVTVLSGGTLAGTGTVPSVILADGSTLAPGVSGGGTLHVAGSVSFSNSSNFLVNVSSASSSALATSGPDQLAGTLSVVSTNGTYPLDQKLTILTSQSGVTGSLNAAPIPSQGATFAPKLSYDANNVYLQINLAKLSPLLPADATRNEAGPVNGIDTAIASGSVPTYQFQNLGNDSSAGLAVDADQMSGELGSDLPLVGRSLMNPFLDSIFNHVGDEQLSGNVSRSGPQQDANIWATAFKGASIFSADQDTGAHKFKSSIVGISGGADFQVSQHIRLGGSLSIGSSDFHLADDLGAGTATAVQAAAYGLVHFNARLYGAFAGAVALDNIATNRALTVSGADDLTASVKSKIVSGRYESGLTLGWATPYIAVQDELTALPAYSENASSGADTFALAYDSRTANDASLELGLRQSGDIITTKNWTLRMMNRFAWSYNMSGGSAAQAAFEALPSSSFTVYGANTGRNTALFSFGAELESKRGFNVNLRLDSGISANSQTYNGMAGIAFNW